MKIENKIRLWRYGIGTLLLIVSMSLFNAVGVLEPEKYTLDLIAVILSLTLGFVGIVSAAILIGRCEVFIKNKEYLINEK